MDRAKNKLEELERERELLAKLESLREKGSQVFIERQVDTTKREIV